MPADNLPYTMEGWVIEATPEQQNTMWWSGIDALATVHRTDWRAPAWSGCVGRAAPGIEQQMGYYRRFFDWAGPGLKVPVLESTWRWLVEHQPAETGEIVLSWGDSRIGNMIWDNFECAAVIDWEMASLGQPELDLGWWLYFDRQFSDGLGVPRPAGFGSHEDTIARYSELMGRPMQDLFFYEVFSGFRFAVVMMRLSDLLLGSDILPSDSDMGTNNLATQLLATMLELAPPPAAVSRGSPVGPRPPRPPQALGHPPDPVALLAMASCQPSRIVCTRSTESILATTRTTSLSSYPGRTVRWNPPKGSSRPWGGGSCIT